MTLISLHFTQRFENSNLLKVYYGRVQITTTANVNSPLGYNGTSVISGQPWYPDNIIALIPISAYLPTDYGIQALVGEYTNNRLVISSKVAGTFDVNFAIIYKG